MVLYLGPFSKDLCKMHYKMSRTEAAMENSLVVPQKVKHGISIWSSNSTFGAIPRELKEGPAQILAHKYS